MMIPFGCLVCGKIFSTKDNLELHQQSHLEGQKTLFSCADCGKSSTTQGEII